MALNRENLEALTGLSPKEAAALPRETDELASQQQSLPATEPRQTPGYDRPSKPFHNPALSDETFADRDPRRLQNVDQLRDAGEPDPSQPRDERPPMMVPHTRVTEEAEKRRAADERYAELKAQNDRLNERFSMMLEAMNAQQEAKLKPAEQAIPDPDEDLPGYLRALEERDKARQQQIDELRRDRDEFRQQGQLQQQIQAVQQRAAMDEAVFVQQAPTFREAYNFWRQSQIGQLTALGVDQGVAQRHIDTMELQISAMAQQQGQNSAERFYRAAEAAGWRPKQAAPQGRNVTPIDRHPQYQQQAPQPRAQSLDNMNAGMLESRSLDEASMGGLAMPMDLEQIANLSDADFMARYEELMPRVKGALR